MPSLAGQAEDVLLHPCQTVWTVATLPNGDIVTGGSDGCVRVWSMDFARIAESYVLKVSRETGDEMGFC